MPLSLGSVTTLYRSSTLRTTLVFGLAGVGFALANLILARALPILEYALFALVITFLNVGIPLAPMGADVLLNRRAIERDTVLLLRALATSLLTAAIAVGIAARFYEVRPAALWLIGLAVAAGGINYVAGAHYQSRREFRMSLPLVQGVNFVMLAAALATWAAGVRTAWPALALVAASYLCFAAVGWSSLLRRERGLAPAEEPFRWSEALSCVGVGGIAIVLGQLERLMIPQVLTLEALATYGVLAAIVGSAFRMLWMGVGYSLLPRMRAAADVPERRRLLAHELRTVGAVVALASVLIWLITPWLVAWALAGKYVLPSSLVLAALVNGILKVGSAFARTAATALGENRQLAYLNGLGWVALAVAIAGAAVGARWGLTGVIYGVSLGWLSQGVFAALIAAPHLRRPREEPVLAVSP